MPVCGSPNALYFGRSNFPDKIYNLVQILADAKEQHFDFVQIPLGRSTKTGEYEFEPAVASDLVLDSKSWGSAVVGEVSRWIDPDGEIPERSLKALAREVQWASHLAVSAVMLPAPNPLGCSRYGNFINRIVTAGSLLSTLAVTIPMVHASGKDGWYTWNTFRRMCEHTNQIFVALELTPEMSKVPQRWMAEPIRYVIVPTRVFLKNKNDYPVLSKPHQQFLMTLFERFKVQIIIEADDSVEGQRQDDDYDACKDIENYINYIARHFQQKPELSQAEYFGLSYRDYLQAPLQPLQDNLESQTYETFEKDPVKYVQYEEAVFKCIQDKQAAKGSHSMVLMVVGAGRGPLVQASLNAAHRANLEKFEVWAVEKNPNAVITLRHKKRDEVEWDPVTIINEDMRTWIAPTKADIMVSELLGSFSDNELSPECLDGAQRFLADDGVSIPQHYYSTLRLLSAPKLWTDLKDKGGADITRFETAYVVKLHEHWCPSNAEKVFSFSHPNWSCSSNDRYKSLQFTVTDDALIHGFAGYFHCDLYQDVHISIEPETESVGMFSWFPIYFPLTSPMYLKKGEKVVVDFWRCGTERQVWYEWSVVSHGGQMHNPGGRSYYIGK